MEGIGPDIYLAFKQRREYRREGQVMFRIYLNGSQIGKAHDTRAVNLLIGSRSKKTGVDPECFEVRYWEDYNGNQSSSAVRS